jgi:potassium-transporting ATPase KdpC subunit
MLSQLRSALIAFACLTLLTGVLYPLVVTVIAKAAFHEQAEGSLTMSNGVVTGSKLLGQPFEGPKYFWGRLSATSPFPYNAGSSTASNLGPTNPALVDAVNGRMKALKDADPTNTALVPVDLVTASGSGLDPEISVAAADYQLRRVARARGASEDRVRTLVEGATRSATLGVFGEPRVNVLELNVALDAMK